jgi:heat shock protein HtpX
MTRHSLNNHLHTLLFIAGMLILLGALGLTLGGGTGLLWASVLGAAFLVFSQRVSPALVFRFYGGRPLSYQEVPGLSRLMVELARRAELPAVPRLFLLPGSLTNAVTVGAGADAGIGVTGALLQRLEGRELANVLAHEISHIRHNDTRVMQVAATLNRLTGLFAFFGQILLFLNLPLLLMGRATFSWSAILLLLSAPTLSGLLQLALSRTREYEADLGAVRLTGDPLGLASALQKLEFYQSGWLRRFFLPGYRSPQASLFRTHPQTAERVERLRSLQGDYALRVPPLELGDLNYAGRPYRGQRRPRWFYL